MSAQLSVAALKISLKDGTVLEGGYRLHRKFLAKIFALADEKPEIKNWLTQKGFYLPENNPIQKMKILKENGKFFFALLTKEDLKFLVPDKFVSDTLKFRKTDELLKTDDRNLEKFPLLLKVKEHLMKSAEKTEKIQEYLNSWRGVFEIFLDSSEVSREINEGMTVDIQKEAKISSEKDNHWKLHIHIDMSHGSKNNQEKVNTAYNILLDAVKKHEIKSLKLVAPFANINDMQGREISIYLKFENPGERKKIAEFISEVEDAFKKNGIVATQLDSHSANRKIKGSEYFSFRNEHANNSRRYFSGENAKILTNFLNSNNNVLFQYYNAASDVERNSCVNQLRENLLDEQRKKLYEIIGVQNVPLSDFFKVNFPAFLQNNINTSIQDFLKIPPPHSPHNPFKFADTFDLEACDLTQQQSLQPLQQPQPQASSLLSGTPFLPAFQSASSSSLPPADPQNQPQQQQQEGRAILHQFQQSEQKRMEEQKAREEEQRVQQSQQQQRQEREDDHQPKKPRIDDG